MNQAELVAAVAARTGISKAQSDETLKDLGEVVTDALKAGGDVALPGLGKFGVTQRAAREGRNPATGESIQIAARHAPKFSPAKALKDALNTPAKKGKK